MCDPAETNKRARARGDRVLVVGSINVDLYQRIPDGRVRFHGAPVDVSTIKGQTLPARSFAQNPAIKTQISELPCEAGKEEVRAEVRSDPSVAAPLVSPRPLLPKRPQAFLLRMDGPFDQKTGGKGANTAAAAGQTWPCEFVGNLGSVSADANAALRADLVRYGAWHAQTPIWIPPCLEAKAPLLPSAGLRRPRQNSGRCLLMSRRPGPARHPVGARSDLRSAISLAASPTCMDRRPLKKKRPDNEQEKVRPLKRKRSTPRQKRPDPLKERPDPRTEQARHVQCKGPPAGARPSQMQWRNPPGPLAPWGGFRPASFIASHVQGEQASGSF
jgi:hypothetical protein